MATAHAALTVAAALLVGACSTAVPTAPAASTPARADDTGGTTAPSPRSTGVAADEATPDATGVHGSARPGAALDPCGLLQPTEIEAATQARIIATERSAGGSEIAGTSNVCTYTVSGDLVDDFGMPLDRVVVVSVLPTSASVTYESVTEDHEQIGIFERPAALDEEQKQLVVDAGTHLVTIAVVLDGQKLLTQLSPGERVVLMDFGRRIAGRV